MNDMDRIVPLDQLDDFEVSTGDPDVRGWSVCSGDGSRIGEVDNLLVDTSARKVRYLDVSLDASLLGLAPNQDRHVLIPIGFARLDEPGAQVRVEALTSAELVGLPPYSHEPLTREYEDQLRQRLDRGYQGDTGIGTEFYAHALYDADRFYRAAAGGSGEMS